jgi:hypothetical protein
MISEDVGSRNIWCRDLTMNRGEASMVVTHHILLIDSRAWLYVVLLHLTPNENRIYKLLCLEHGEKY